MNPMAWEQMLLAIKSVCPSAHLEMREPGNWYVSASMEHAQGDSMLVGDYGNGPTPQDAVIDHWQQYGDGRPFLVRDQWLRWNGFMFEKSDRPPK